MSSPSPLEYEQRIHALEKLNATLAAEVDAMRGVVDATVKEVTREDDRFSWLNLKVAVDAYQATKEQG